MRKTFQTLDFPSKDLYTPHMVTSPRSTESYRVVDRIIMDIERLPHGYAFWRSLPAKGKRSCHTVRKRWAGLLIETFFPAIFLTALVSACLSPDGVPDQRGKLLYEWLLKYVYSGQERRLYADWLSVKRGQQHG